MIDKIEIYPATGVINVRRAATYVHPITGATEKAFHRSVVMPEDDIDAMEPEIQAAAAAYHTQAVLQARLNKLQADRDERATVVNGRAVTPPASDAEQRLASKITG